MKENNFIQIKKNVQKLHYSIYIYQMLLSIANSGYTFFVSMYIPWELNPQPFALLTQCSTTEPLKHLDVISE